MSTIKRSTKDGERGRIDRTRLEKTTEEDIARQIAEDPDTAPEITQEDLKRARLVRPLQPAAE